MTAEGITARVARLERARHAQRPRRGDGLPEPAESPEDVARYWAEVAQVLDDAGVLPFPDAPEPTGASGSLHTQWKIREALNAVWSECHGQPGAVSVG